MSTAKQMAGMVLLMNAEIPPYLRAGEGTEDTIVSSKDWNFLVRCAKALLAAKPKRVKR